MKNEVLTNLKFSNRQIALFHGTDYIFNKFEFKNVGKKSGTDGAGFGIYLSTHKLDALIYGKYLLTVIANFKTCVSNEVRTLSDSLISEMLNRITSVIPHEKTVSDYSTFVTDTAIINRMIDDFDTSVMISVLKHFGITHAVDTTTPEINGYEKDVYNFVVYDLDCLNIIEARTAQKIYQVSDYDKIVSTISFDLNEATVLPTYEDLTENYDVEQFMLQYEPEIDNLTQEEGRAKSKSQRRLMAMALMYKRGKLDKKYASDTIKKLANSIDQKTLEEFAKTKQKKRKKDGSIGKRNAIPERVKK